MSILPPLQPFELAAALGVGVGAVRHAQVGERAVLADAPPVAVAAVRLPARGGRHQRRPGRHPRRRVQGVSQRRPVGAQPLLHGLKSMR